MNSTLTTTFLTHRVARPWLPKTFNSSAHATTSERVTESPEVFPNWLVERARGGDVIQCRRYKMGGRAVPKPRQPDGPDPFVTYTTPREHEGDLWGDITESIAWTALEARRWMPVVRGLLDESEKLLSLDPSASVVWSVQALELFLKTAVLRPVLRVRLTHDSGLAEEIFKALLARNGPKAAREWLERLIALPQEEGSKWQHRFADLFGEHGVVSWRNRIVHQGEIVSPEEGRKALEDVGEFIDSLGRFLEDFLNQWGATYNQIGREAPWVEIISSLLRSWPRKPLQARTVCVYDEDLYG